MPRPQLRALRVILTVMFLAAAAFAAGPVQAAPPDVSQIEFYARRGNDLPIVPTQSFDLTVRRTTGTGPLHFAEIVDGSPVDLGTTQWESGGSVNGVSIWYARLPIADPSEGVHHYQAIFDANENYDALTLDLDVTVEKAATSITIGVDYNPVQVNHTATLISFLDRGGSDVVPAGTVEWRDVDTDVVLKTALYADDRNLAITPTAPGTRHIRVTYSGDDVHTSSTSETLTLTALADRVEASGVTIDVSNFYPYKDGYRDVVKIKGTRLEPASVAVSIYNSSNRRVRTMSLARADGAYSLSWNGRSNAGNLQPAGKYRIVQVLTDAAGMKLSVTKYVNLSNKRLYYSTRYVTKLGSSVSAVGHTGNASVTVSSTTGIARVRASSGSWAGAGYQFTLPSATVYKSISFQAYVKGALSVPTNWIGIQNFNACALSYGWYEDCFERWEAIGSSSGVPEWHWTSGSTTTNRTGRTARGMVSVYYGSAYVYKVRIKVTIGVLK